MIFFIRESEVFSLEANSLMLTESEDDMYLFYSVFSFIHSSASAFFELSA